MKRCAYCEEEMRYLRSQALYCSTNCRVRAYQERSKNKAERANMTQESVKGGEE